MDVAVTIKIVSSSLGYYCSTTSHKSIIQSQSSIKCSSFISCPNLSRTLAQSKPLDIIIAVNFTNAAIDGKSDGLEWARVITKRSVNGYATIDVINDFDDVKHDD